MKKKGKIQITAEALTFVLFISAFQKTAKLVKEVKEMDNPDKSFTTSATSTELISRAEDSMILQITTEPTETLNLVTSIPEELPTNLTTAPTELPLTVPTETKEPTIEQEMPTIEQELPTVETETEPTVTQEQTIPTEPIYEENVAYTTTNVNMRSSNTTDALRINNLEVNEKVYKILSCDNNWDLVRCNGKIGYICRDYLNYSGETTESKYQYIPKKDIALTANELNFRPTPSTEVKSITRFGKDEEIEVLAEVDNGWYLVKSNGKLGYVHGDYITSLLDRANAQYPDLNLTELETQKVVYAKTGLNIRNGAGEEHDKIGFLEEFETVRVMKEYDDWYFVMTNDYNFGFVHRAYTEELNGTFIITDLSEQRLWQYHNSTLYYTTPVTTGKDGHESDIGKTEVLNKAQDCYLMGQKHVDYWIGINNDEEGIHDAKWRYKFGKEVNYHLEGSHGCTNAPPEIMPDIYEATSLGDTVVVHL